MAKLLEVKISQAQFADLVGISEARVSQLIAEGTLSRGATARTWLDAYLDRLREQAAGRAEAPEITTERARLLAAQAAREQLRLGEDRGELIRVDAVRTVMSHSYVAVRDAILNIPARMAAPLAAESDPAEIQNLLHVELHDALTELASAPLRLGGTDDAA
jgi:phage terminase Nu1 subunit (DNA packaging protein)